MRYYLIKNREMPWGDYGNILFAGLLTTFDENYNDIEIHRIKRAGPYIPDIYIGSSNKIVIASELYNILVKNNISGILCKHETVIEKFVKIEWNEWSPLADPKKYPRDNVPYNYINYGKHNEELLKTVQKVYYSLDIEILNVLKFVSDIPDHQKYTDFKIISDQANNDIINIHGGLIVNEKVKNLIEANTDNCLRFIELQTV